MNRLGTGTRLYKAKTIKLERYSTETVSIPTTAWSRVSGAYQATVSMFDYRWSVNNCLVVNWSGASTISSITFDGLSTLIPRYIIRLSSSASKPTSAMSITIMSTFDDIYNSSSVYQNDNYHAVKLDNEEFNLFATLLPSIDETYINVSQDSDTTLSIYISNPRAYNLEILYAGISISDSDQSTLSFDLSDLITTELEAGSQDEVVFHIDMDDYTGCNISDYSIELEIGGPGVRTYYFIQET